MELRRQRPGGRRHDLRRADGPGHLRRPSREGREADRPGPGAALAADPAFVKGLAAVSADARRLDAGSDIYYLWSIERVCVALGQKKLDGFDWYAKGARELLGRQQADGSWPQGRWGALPDTCLALLFLRKANLAFELDRVLKLPDPDRPARPAGEKAPEPPKAPRGDGGDAEVIVRGTSEREFPEIALDFELKAADGQAILDATKDDFRVTEYGEPVEIRSFRSPLSKEPRPTTVVLVLDRSKSMEEEDRIGGLKKAVGSFLANQPAGSRVAVIAFGSEVDLICNFTDDAGKVQKAVDSLTPGGAMRYYDAVSEAVKLLAREPGRRAILAMTDGEDTFSQTATLKSVVNEARNEGLPVHTLGLGSEDEIATDDLKALADGTRGQFFAATQAEGLRAIYEEIAKGLGQAYSLTYRTDRKLPDGTLRPITVSYRKSAKVGTAQVYIPGMVVPAAGWSPLFLILVAGLTFLAILPGRLRRRAG